MIKLTSTSTQADAIAYLRQLLAAGLMYHFDDPMDDIEWSDDVTAETIELIEHNDGILCEHFDVWALVEQAECAA